MPEYGWTTQKVFHLMNFIVNGGDIFQSFMMFGFLYFLILDSYTFSFGCILILCLCLSYVTVRAIVFGFHAQVFVLQPKVSLSKFQAMPFWNSRNI